MSSAFRELWNNPVKTEAAQAMEPPSSDQCLGGMRIQPVATALGIVVLATASAHADTVEGTKSSAMVNETKHEISLRLDRGHATFVVRRTFRNTGEKHDQAMVHITDLPSDAVATGLRTLAMNAGKPTWYSGELMEAEAAAKKYRELTGIGGYYPKDPALLSWRSHGHLALQVFPIDPGGSKTVEYTLEAPTSYEGGRDVLEIPHMGTELEVTLSVAAERSADTLYVADGKVTSPATFPMSTGIRLSLERGGAQPKLGGRFASVFLGKRNLLHAVVEAAPRLSEIPAGVRVVVLLDASRSMGEVGRTAEIASASAYLAQFLSVSDAQVEIITFARKTRSRHVGFVSVKQALMDLETLKFDLENGSDIDNAFSVATRLLDTSKSDAPKRIVAFTDFRTRAALSPEALTLLSKQSRAIVHVATVDVGGTAILSRDDDNRWTQVARTSGGVFWHVSVPELRKPTADTLATFEELARPIRVDHVHIPGWLGAPSMLLEGTAYEDTRLSALGPTSLAVSGELWSKPISTTLESNAVENRLWSALAIGSSHVEGTLTEPELMILATKGHAVSPVTSFLAVEPGVRPSTEGLEWGASGLGLSGMGSGCGGRIGSLGSARRKYDHLGYLTAQLRKSVSMCKAEGRAIQIRIETTLDEVVSAELSSMSGGSNPVMSECLLDAVWALDLPSGDFHQAWSVFDVKL